MTPANAELIEVALGHIDRADVPALLKLLDPAIEWYPPAQGTLERVYNGHDGVRKLFEQLYEAWKTIQHKPMKLVEGPEHTVVVTHVLLQSRTGAMSLDEVWAYVVQIRDGKFATVSMYTDPAEAVRANTSDVLASAPSWPETEAS